MTVQIKTVIESHNWPGDFDNQVNTALSDGWQLVRRDILPGSDRFYAELVKDDQPQQKPAEPIPWQRALLTLHELCSAVEHCADCPADEFCTGGAPDSWDVDRLQRLSL